MEKAHWLDDLKLRFGWGQLGNSNVALYSSFTNYPPESQSITKEIR